MKIAHQVFLLLVATVLIAVAAMGLFFAFNLEHGFVNYLNARQLEQFEALQRVVSEQAQRLGSLEHLRDNRRAWHRLLRLADPAAAELRQEIDDRPPPRPPRGPEFEQRPPRERSDVASPRDGPPAESRGLPPAPPEGDRRFAIVDADRRPFFESPRRPGLLPATERAISAGGRTVAWLQFYALDQPVRTEDIAFLHSQYLRIVWVALGLVLLALLASPIVARRWTRPLREIGAFTEHIARGEFAARLSARRSDEIGALMHNVNAMAKSLSGLDAARRRWIAETSHELRTPLAVLRGEIEALQDGLRPLDARSLKSLHDEILHLTEMVNDLHLLALADMGALPCTMRRVDLGDIVRKAAQRFSARAQQRGLQLAVKAPQHAIAVEADEDRLVQVLNNLLENSLRYTDTPGCLEIAVESGRHQARLLVQDSAPGVAATECARIFEPLYRADPARSRKAGGSGLGLAICRAIVEAHRGSISAAPSPLGGLAITITFKLAA
jgi:two-component system sensor histidine kinase BaeS